MTCPATCRHTRPRAPRAMRRPRAAPRHGTTQHCTMQCNTYIQYCRYRTISGRCNNLGHPQYGARGQPQPRLHPPQYDDLGLETARSRGVGGDQLPGPREVSQVRRAGGVAPGYSWTSAAGAAPGPGPAGGGGRPHADADAVGADGGPRPDRRGAAPGLQLLQLRGPQRVQLPPHPGPRS